MESIETEIRSMCKQHSLATMLWALSSAVANNAAGMSSKTPSHTRDEIVAKLQLAKALADQQCCKD